MVRSKQSLESGVTLDNFGNTAVTVLVIVAYMLMVWIWARSPPNPVETTPVDLRRGEDSFLDGT